MSTEQLVKAIGLIIFLVGALVYTVFLWIAMREKHKADMDRIPKGKYVNGKWIPEETTSNK